jgi:DNA-binding NarL/FixJ family response regulator
MHAITPITVQTRTVNDQYGVSAIAAAMALTTRQAEVLRLAGRCLSGKQIARHLGISVRT